MKKLILHICLLLQCCFLFSQNTENVLKSKWEFRKKGTEIWFPAVIPGTVHSDLFLNKQIPDPYFGDNERKLQWIENEDWEYKTVFICDKKTLSQSHVELEFEGLDTYAKIFLNGKLIQETDNMFRSWLLDVKQHLKEGENILLILFESAVKKGKAEAAKLSYTLPGDEKVFTRKAQFQYGWDFAPRFVTCGIWKPIKLITWNKLKVNSVYAVTKEIKDSTAKVDFIFEINCDQEGNYDIRHNVTAAGQIREPGKIKSHPIALKRGIISTIVSVEINKAKLWWCNGMGEGRPNIYNIGYKITEADTLVASNSVKFGIRTLELVQDKDTAGSSFYLKLNGIPVFMKGANYIPQNSFLPSVQKSDYRKLMLLAKEANINMLRVWGGGVYADEEFYQDCDRVGILVWQDFMFACAMYPSNKEFIENVKQEAAEQVKRLRNHPCLALWCGNNEIDEGWHNWGWQKQYNYSKTDSAKIWNDCKNLFHEILPSIVKQNDLKTTYWPSSPSIGWGRKESLKKGDSHYWGVWWGKEPFEVYEKKVGRFMSEYGFQSLPDIKSFKTFCGPTELNLTSASVKHHQKHPTGYETISEYMKRDFNVPKDFEKFIYVSQLLQAQGMKTAIETHRRAKPYCMGTLFWQLNDCWPGTTWSSIAFNNTPKAFYYDLARLYNNVLVSVVKENNNYKVYIINDNSQPIEGKLNISLRDFSGNELFVEKMDTTLAPNSSQTYYIFPEKNLKKEHLAKIYLRCAFNDNYGVVKRKALYYFTQPKNLKLPKINPEFSYDQAQKTLSVKSKVLIKNLYLFGGDAAFGRNYFDLEPGEEIKLEVKSPFKDISEIKFLSLNTINE